jgi:hypothetical protein
MYHLLGDTQDGCDLAFCLASENQLHDLALSWRERVAYVPSQLWLEPVEHSSSRAFVIRLKIGGLLESKILECELFENDLRELMLVICIHMLK